MSESDGGRAVTTVVRRRVRPERRADYEQALRELLAEAESLEGFLGAEVHPPSMSAEPAIYVSVFRFRRADALERFERSELRAAFLERVRPLVDADAVWDTHTGLEFWFDPPPGTVVAQPVRWRMALVLGVVVYVLVLVFGAIAGELLGDLAFPVRLALVIAVEITLMTYLILPWITRRLASWIYPRTVAST